MQNQQKTTKQRQEETLQKVWEKVVAHNSAIPKYDAKKVSDFFAEFAKLPEKDQYFDSKTEMKIFYQFRAQIVHDKYKKILKWKLKESEKEYNKEQLIQKLTDEIKKIVDERDLEYVLSGLK